MEVMNENYHGVRVPREQTPYNARLLSYGSLGRGLREVQKLCEFLLTPTGWSFTAQYVAQETPNMSTSPASSR